MTLLKTTSRGQVTLRQDIFRHLGLEPGDQVEVDLLPHGRVQVRKPSTTRSWDDVFAYFRSLPPHEGPAYTLEELDEAVGLALGEDDERIKREYNEYRAQHADRA